MFSYNDDLRCAECRLVFNADELCRLAAEAVNRSPGDIVRMHKLAECGFNRTFLITMRGGFRMVARIPYPVSIPKYFAVASEVATMALLRSSAYTRGVRVLTYVRQRGRDRVYLHGRGTKLSDIWFDLGEGETISISRQLAELESKMTSIAFPGGGSLYYTEDLKNAAGSASWSTRPGITLEDNRFCVSLDTSVRLWYGRRSLLDLDRGSFRGGLPCPVVFDPDGVHGTMELDAEQTEADDVLEACWNVIGFGPEGWVPVEHYEQAMAISKKLKEDALAAAESEEEQAQVAAHWPFDDMDEEEYMNESS
ncbi:hypothetical protein HETIRDRAFT_423131 [Heterobasidion irregulare TC 32-1]|uniref:Uncharacterized protein n=1 Tax=Heterobasidion irregulare (strain TC 32-1) TaxID=747525 RepID=W4JQT0_HETIT|nr:uncharacterized protein HETIRDRAFT_423131 [Heterobasidion irregulare TC 32-1]ETW75440.1 hypothetical protein HETIRDRAFT_423131 [Heterobasidion irregulare TC 32-1]